MTFPSVLMLSPNPFFCSGEIRLKGVASPQCIQPVQEPGLGWWELGAEGFSPLVPLHALSSSHIPVLIQPWQDSRETSLFMDPA